MMVNYGVLLVAYLLGSIPFGLLITRTVGVDVRTVGSGNIGATNVLRTGKKWLAALTLLMDTAKGYAAVLVAAYGLLYGDVGNYLCWLYAAGMAAILGHIFPAWLKFKGGKGVATALGVLSALAPLLAGYYVLCWCMVFALSRYASLASIAGFWFLLPVNHMTGQAIDPLFLLLVALLATWTHRTNIRRLRAGEEPKIGVKK